MDSKHFSKLERMYLAAPLHQFYDTLSISISKGVCEIELDVEEKYFHAMGAMHGSVYFKLLDDAAFFAAQSAQEQKFILTTKFHIDLVRPLKSGRIKAVGEIIRNSHHEIFAKAVLYDARGKIAASGTGQFVRSKTDLTKVESYK